MITLADVVILNYNNKEHIQKCIEALSKYSIDKINLIVIDQNSTDGSRELLQKDYRINKLILNDINNGAWAGRNQGVRAAITDRIVFFDSDTQVRNDWLPPVLDVMKENDSGIVEMRVQLYNNDWRLGGFAACMVKREVFQEIGIFDPKFLIGGDNDFWARYMHNDKWKFKYCIDTDIYHYCGGTITRGCMKDKAQELHQKYRIDLLESIYTRKFLENTQWKYNKLRFYFEQKLGWRNG